MTDSDAEKDHAPSEKRLQDARRRGEFARSADVNAAAAQAGLLLAVATGGGAAVAAFGTVAMQVLSVPPALSGALRAPGDRAALADALMRMLLPAAGLFLAPAAVVLVLLIAQRGIVFAPEKLMPRLSRISPVATAAQRFGRTGLVEFAKSLAKAAATAGILIAFLAGNVQLLVMAQQMEPAQIALLLGQRLVAFLAAIAALSLVIGGMDYLWQRFDHLRRNRMSRQEVIDEHREAEGDPHVKGQRRQRAREIAMNRMLADVPKADVVVVNPTHYAVALRWDRDSGRPPLCVAKGTDGLAARIREAAAVAGVPTRSDPPTARAIHASVDVGQPIRPEHYAAVAAAIRFAEAMRRKARARNGG